MSAKRLLVVATVALAAGTCIPAAQAVECGTGDAVGALKLAQDQSKPTPKFGTETGERAIALYFAVEGCTLPAEPKVAAKLVPGNVAGGDLTMQHVASTEITRSSPTTLDVVFVVRSSFKPGTYGALAQVTGDGLALNRTPVAVSRSEDSMLWPIGLGAIGALAGLALWLATKSPDQVRLKDWWRIAFVIVAALVVGGLAGLAIYTDQDIWRLKDNFPVTLGAGFTSASAATIVSVRTVLERRDTSPAPARTPARTLRGATPKQAG